MTMRMFLVPAALAFVVLLSCIAPLAIAKEKANNTGWQPEDVAVALETINYGTTICDFALPFGAMRFHIEGWGKALGIGGAALSNLMVEKQPMVRQMADLVLPAFCSQAKAVADQFGML